MNANNYSLLQEILVTIPDGRIENVVVGSHWTSVSLFVNKIRLCGLAATINHEDTDWNGHFKALSDPSLSISAKMLISRLALQLPPLASVATATLNALLQYPLKENPGEILQAFDMIECNAEELILKHGTDRRVVIIGHFPFTEKVKSVAKHLDVLELNPRPGDLPAEFAPNVLPYADVIAITGMTWINGTLESLLSLCNSSAVLLLLGASTPLTPVLFSHGFHYLCGALVNDIDSVMQAVAKGLPYRQIIPAGLKLITLFPHSNRS